jgi:hypothetical protein
MQQPAACRHAWRWKDCWGGIRISIKIRMRIDGRKLERALEGGPGDGVVAETEPELAAVVVVVEEEDVALGDAGGAELGEAAFDERGAEAVAAVFGSDGEVVEVTAATVVAAEDGGDDVTFGIAGEEAHAGVAGEEAFEGLAFVGFVEAEAVLLAPEGDDGVVVGGGEGGNGGGHGVLQVKAGV